MGFTRCPHSRRHELAQGAPLPVEIAVLRRLECGRVEVTALESAIHKALAPFRTHGEWFHGKAFMLARHYVQGGFLLVTPEEVLSLIREEPGITTATLKRRMDATPRSISTSLTRHRRAGRIELRKGGWYPIEGEPAVAETPSKALRLHRELTEIREGIEAMEARAAVLRAELEALG